MNWISKQNAQRKANLLKYNPVVDHASDAPLHYPNKKMAKVEDKLTILGGDPAFPTDPDMSKPRNKRFSKKVASWSNEKRDRKREKFQDLHQRQFEAFEYGQKIPNRMEGSPLGKRFMGINPDHKGYCTPMTKATCTPRRKALAKRLKPGGDLYKGKKS